MENGPRSSQRDSFFGQEVHGCQRIERLHADAAATNHERGQQQVGPADVGERKDHGNPVVPPHAQTVDENGADRPQRAVAVQHTLGVRGAPRRVVDPAHRLSARPSGRQGRAGQARRVPFGQTVVSDQGGDGLGQPCRDSSGHGRVVMAVPRSGHDDEARFGLSEDK